MAWITAAELRQFDTDLADYDEDKLENAITLVEAELERILGTAYNSRTVTDEWHLGDGTEWLRLDKRWPTAISAVSIDGTALSAGTIADMVVDRQAGMVRYRGGWSEEKAVLVTYTHGKTAPPEDLKWAAKILARKRLRKGDTPIPDGATRFVADSGGTFALARPGAVNTGDDDVDAILHRYLLPGIA